MSKHMAQPDTSLLEQSSRIALSAFLHDLGKFAERARIPVDKDMLEINKQLYCPHRKEFTYARGWFSHVHAAYTGVAMDVIEQHLSDLIGADVLHLLGHGRVKTPMIHSLTPPPNKTTSVPPHHWGTKPYFW